MKSTIEAINPVQYRVSIEVAPEEVNVAFEAIYKNLQKKARIQGFRPGKAPLGVIRKLYGGSAAGEAHEKLINEHLFGALGEKSIRPIASPVVESREVPKEGQSFNFSAVVDVMPTLTIDNYKGVAVSAETYTVKDAALDREIYLLRRRHARTSPVEPGQPAAKGMLAAVSHTAKLDGVDLQHMNVQNMTVHLGEGEIFEGLEAALLGMTVGSDKTAKIRLPDTYGDKDLASKELDFHLTVTDLKHMQIPQLDDEFAKDLNFDSVEKLKTDVQTHLAGRAKDMSRQKLETAVLDKLIDANPFEVPPAMVDQVIDSIIQEMGFQSEDDKKRALTDKDLRQNVLPTAKRRTQNTLLLWHVTQKEQLQVTDDDVQRRIEETIASTGLNDPKQTSRLRRSIEPRVRENMIFEKAMDFLIDNAQVSTLPAEL